MEMPTGPFSGGCQCGAVRFHAEALHDNPHVCYCRMCQKATGNLFVSLVGVRHENLTWTRGQPSRFRSSEHVDRGFCSACGTPPFYQYLPGQRVSLSIGAFDEPHRISLRWQMGMQGKHPSLFTSTMSRVSVRQKSPMARKQPPPSEPPIASTPITTPRNGRPRNVRND